MAKHQKSQDDRDDLLPIGDLQVISKLVSRFGWPISAAAGFFFFLAVLYLQVAEFEYRAQLIVAPSDLSISRSQGASDLNLGGILSNAIGSPSSASASPFSIYLSRLKSLETAENLANDKSLMTRIFAESWDSAAQEWRKPRSVLFTLKYWTKSLLGLPVSPWKQPTSADLEEYLAKSVAIIENDESAFVTITYYSSDRAFAKSFLEKLHLETDRSLREMALAQSRDLTKYLQEELQKSSVSEYKTVIADALLIQHETTVMAQRPLGYASTIVSGPNTFDRSVRPNAQFVLVTSPFAGAFISICVILFRSLPRDN